jgi:hypothetical protein
VVLEERMPDQSYTRTRVMWCNELPRSAGRRGGPGIESWRAQIRSSLQRGWAGPNLERKMITETPTWTENPPDDRCPATMKLVSDIYSYHLCRCSIPDWHTGPHACECSRMWFDPPLNPAEPGT